MSLLWILVACAIAIAFVGVVVANHRRGGAAPVPARPAPSVPADLASLDETAFRSRLIQEIDAGRTIEAIKWVRARTGLGLKEAKEVVDALAAGDVGVTLERHPGQIAGLDDADFAASLVVEIAAGRKLEAIRLYRERTGLGLKQAKDAVEALERGA